MPVAPELSVALDLIETVPRTVAPVGLVIVTVGGVVSADPEAAFCTFNETGDDVAEFPAASNATPVRETMPSGAVAEFQLNWYGAVLVLATVDPLTRKSTRVTPTLSLAFTLTVTLPDTVPPVGEAIATVGGVVSEPGDAVFDTFTVAGEDVFELPAASYATAVSVVDPSGTVAEFQVNR